MMSRLSLGGSALKSRRHSRRRSPRLRLGKVARRSGSESLASAPLVGTLASDPIGGGGALHELLPPDETSIGSAGRASKALFGRSRKVSSFARIAVTPRSCQRRRFGKQIFASHRRAPVAH